jgi:hypothetical protein
MDDGDSIVLKYLSPIRIYGCYKNVGAKALQGMQVVAEADTDQEGTKSGHSPLLDRVYEW